MFHRIMLAASIAGSVAVSSCASQPITASVENALSADKEALFSQVLAAQATLVADIETQCVYVTPEGLGAFTFDARGMAQQYYLHPSTDGQWQLIPVREFAMGGEAEACMVDIATGVVFVAEEAVGLWQFAASPESDLSRRFLPLSLDEDIEAITLSSASTLMVTTESGTVHHVSLVRPTSLATPLPVLPADGQTDPVQRYGDAADDPAIWVNPHHPEQSLIIGTDKKAGLDVYDLSGKRLQHLPVGRVNNVDVRQQVRFNQDEFDIAVASNRSGNVLSLFAIDANTRNVSHIADLNTPLTDIYGLCLYQPAQGLEVLVNDTDGTYLRYQLQYNNEHFEAVLLEKFHVPSQPEGCVADDKHHMLYYGEEASGVWQKSLASVGLESIKIADVNELVQADIEGMDIYHLDGKRYLVVSSQGNDSYAVYALDNNPRWLGSFRIGADIDKGVDGASETDGLAITSVNLGTAYPEGLMVVQDGHNVMPSDKQNFKLVSGEKLAAFIRQRR